jgi:hypothetical protein
MRRSGIGRAAFAALVLCAFVAPAAPALAALTPRERTVLRSYLDALSAGRFGAAYALLSADERRYFGSSGNLASVYRADGLRILGYRILGSETTGKGTVAVVSEHVEFVDHAHSAQGSAVAKVPYAIVAGVNGPVIRDPGHPWRAYAPTGLAAEHDGFRATVRKVSFFTGRIEFVVTFENRSAVPVTVLPYGRSVLRDANGTAFHPVATRLSSLTDKNLYIGLRLPSSAEYTGFITFATPDRFRPRSLQLSLAPALADGADAPFSLDFVAYALPAG